MRITRAETWGLVVAGGQSSRMGQPKSLVEYRTGLPQWKHAALLLAARCCQVFVSVAEASPMAVPAPFTALVDSEKDQGPLHAWFRAAQTSTQHPWLIMNCDLPLADLDMLDALMTPKIAAPARAFTQSDSDQADPQCVLLAPSGLSRLLGAYAEGQRSPRRFLSMLPTHTIRPAKPDWLRGANTPEERRQILDLL